MHTMTTDRHRNPTFSIRLEPRLRYLVERMASYQRRSVSNYIENCILKTLQDTPAPKQPSDSDTGSIPGHTTIDKASELLPLIHGPHPALRFTALLTYAPAMLNDDELAILNFIKMRNNPHMQLVGSDAPAPVNLLHPDNWHILQTAWEHIKAHVIDGKPAYIAESAIEAAASGDESRIAGLVENGFIMRTLQRVEKALREEQELEKTGVEKGNPEERRALLRLVESD